MRIAIINDSPMAVEALRRAIVPAPGLELAWIAMSGSAGVERACAQPPDLILMDILMPGMDGVATTREIMNRCPCPILVVTVSVDTQAARVFEALACGALDAINTPRWEERPDGTGSGELIRRIHLLGTLTGHARRPVQPDPRGALASGANRPRLVVMGASAGGPGALATILGGLPPGFTTPVAVMQHLDGQFQEGLARWLDEQTPLRVVLAPLGHRLGSGEVALLAGGEHLGISPDGEVVVTHPTGREVHRPAIDLLFASVARHYPRQAVGVLLTGMGRDGAQGLKALRDAGCRTIAQDPDSCIVHGMPAAAKALGAVERELPLEGIGGYLLQLCQPLPTPLTSATP